MPTCAEGHVTAAGDYCDVCGSSVADSPVRSPEQSPTLCPVCHASRNGRFCEVCGHDCEWPVPTATGESAPPEASGGWTAVVTADREYYARVTARGGPDTVDFPEFFGERRIRLQPTTLIGRNNRTQAVAPGIDLGIHPVDRGVSTQHAVLRVIDSGLTITDLGSTNGTTLNDSDDLLPNGQETPLADGDRVHVGAWTTITIIKCE